MEGEFILRHSSLLSLLVIALLFSPALAEPYQFGNTFNELQQNVVYQPSPQLRPLPPVESAQQIPATLEPSASSPALLTKFEDPLMEAGDPEFDPMGPEMAAFIKKNSWKKGDFTITPYGFFQTNVQYVTNPATRLDYILWARPHVHGDRPQFGIDAKSTRLGLIVGGPNACLLGGYFKTAGQVEFDFQGQFAHYNKPGVLLRRAFIEMKNHEWRLLAGQEWDVISPLNPGSLNYAVAFCAGNLNYRRPQVRIERTLNHSYRMQTKLQFSINHSIAIDGDASATDDVVDYDAKWPILEGRIGWTLGYRGKGCKPVIIGISGHIGEENYDFDFPVNPQYNVERITWSGNVDAVVPITSRLTARAEFFVGENLSLFLGGINQGINRTTGGTIRSVGGWAELQYAWSSRLRSHCGYTIDDPINQDLAGGYRSYNQSIYLNAIYNLNKNFELGMEVSRWKTGYLGATMPQLTRLEWMARYKF
ncbi:MAG: hypothetical protein PVH19_08495 [Planctomycetia bacterium]|jgi:hypothetical protein